MKKMFEILVSDNNLHESDQLIGLLGRETRLCGGVFAASSNNGRIEIAMAVAERFRDYFVKQVKEEISDYIAVEYKYEYFMKRLNFESISDKEKVAFCSSLAVFDKQTDKKYISEQLLFGNEIVVDSAVAFCMPKLLDRWTEIAELVEASKYELSGGDGILEMMRFLIKSSPSESEKIHLKTYGKNLFVVNDCGSVQFSYCDCADSDIKLLHRIISLLPRQISVHGDRFNYLFSLFPNAKREEVETIM